MIPSAKLLLFLQLCKLSDGQVKWRKKHHINRIRKIAMGKSVVVRTFLIFQ